MLYEEAVTFLLSFHQNCAITTVFCEKNQKIGPGEIWTPVAGFRVLSANRYTTGPLFLSHAFAETCSPCETIDK